MKDDALDLGVIFRAGSPVCVWLGLLILLGLVGCAGKADDLIHYGDGIASASSLLALSPDEGTLWVVNPDADSVTPVDIRSMRAKTPVPVGHEPWSVAVTPTGTVVVMNRVDGSLSLLEAGRRADITIGPELGGLALSPSGRLAYVSVSSADHLAVVDLQARRVVARIPVGRLPWAVAVTDDHDEDDSDETVIVSHRLARLRLGGQEGRNDGKEAWLTMIRGEKVEEITIGPYTLGYPNVLEGLAVSGDMIWVSHLLNSPDLPRDFDDTISGALSTVSLEDAREVEDFRVHMNESDFSTPVNFPRAVAVAPQARTAYIVLAGTDAVMGVDLSQPERAKLIGFWPTGKNPRGIVVSNDGTRAFVMNYLSRDISILELTDTESRREIARVKVAPETLEPKILRGKILFNNANDPRLSRLGWISCESCHIDGGVDGTTWLTPDGLRQTMPLWNLEGTAPFHISATRDEVQDFEHDIEGLMGGAGLAPGAASSELGEPNGGRSYDLDALTAFVLANIRVPKAAPLDADVVVQGREIFTKAGCNECHTGSAWTLSKLPGPISTLAPRGELEVEEILHDIGTYNPETDVLGKNGFDIPTLLGIHATAPYLHDGSARSLEAVMENPGHLRIPLTSEDVNSLTQFLTIIDEEVAPFPWP